MLVCSKVERGIAAEAVPNDRCGRAEGNDPGRRQVLGPGNDSERVAVVLHCGVVGGPDRLLVEIAKSVGLWVISELRVREIGNSGEHNGERTIVVHVGAKLVGE